MLEVLTLLWCSIEDESCIVLSGSPASCNACYNYKPVPLGSRDVGDSRMNRKGSHFIIVWRERQSVFKVDSLERKRLVFSIKFEFHFAVAAIESPESVHIM